METLKIGSKSALVKAWQKFVGVVSDGVFGEGTAKATRFFQAENRLRADGIVGAQTLAAAQKKGFVAPLATATQKPLGDKKYSDAEIISRVEQFAKGFDDWLPGKYDFWVRAPRNPKNVDIFLDKAYSFEVPESGASPIFKMVSTGTSLTGSWALKNFRQYNKFGAAILAANHFVRNSHFYDWHKGYRAYRQGKPFPFYRDGDSDLIPEEIGQIYTNQIIGANCHRAKLNAKSVRNYNWSAACLARNDDEGQDSDWKRWLKYMNKEPLSVGILSQW